MIEKDVAISILQDIQVCLNTENWQGKVRSSANQYKKGILVAIDPEIKKIIEERKQYDEESPEAIKLAEKYNELKDTIYNN